MKGITLEMLILYRLNDVHNALLSDIPPPYKHTRALNALTILWSLIPSEEIRNQITEKLTEYQQAWKERQEELKKLFNEREYDSTTIEMRLTQESNEHTIRMVEDMVEFTTRILIENNLIPREPAAPWKQKINIGKQRNLKA